MTPRLAANSVTRLTPEKTSKNTHPLLRQSRAQYPGATLGGQAGHYPTPAVKGMS